MPRPQPQPGGLEAQLAALTQEFVGRLVEAFRNAAVAEIAAVSAPKVVPAATRATTAFRGYARPPQSPRAIATQRQGREARDIDSRVRQTAARRAELGDRVVQTLERARAPLGVRALSSELGVAPDLLAAPLRELRASGRIRKHGEKRATTYSTG
jgi:hypothetical protein